MFVELFIDNCVLNIVLVFHVHYFNADNKFVRYVLFYFFLREKGKERER